MWVWVQRSGWIVAIVVGLAWMFGPDRSIPFSFLIPVAVLAIVAWRYRDGEPINMSPKDIVAAIEKDDTSIDRARSMRAYVGNLIEIEGEVADISKFSLMGYSTYFVDLRPHHEDDKGTRVQLEFNFVWARDILRLRKGDRLRVRGRIKKPLFYEFTIRAIRRPQITKVPTEDD